MPQNTSTNLQINAQQQEVVDGDTLSVTSNFRLQQSITPSTLGNSAIDSQVSVSGDLAHAATDLYDLKSVTHPLTSETPLNFDRVKIIIIENKATDIGSNIKVKASAANGWTNGPIQAAGDLVVTAGSVAIIHAANLVSDGYPVAAANQNIDVVGDISGSGSSVPYEITLIGTKV